MSGLVTNLEDRIYRKRWRKIPARMSSPSVENDDDQRQSYISLLSSSFSNKRIFNVKSYVVGRVLVAMTF